MYNKREGKEPRAYFQTWYEMEGDPLTFSPRWLDDVTNANCGCCTAGGGKRQQHIGARSGEKGAGKGFTLIGLYVLHGLSHGKRFRSSGEMRIAPLFYRLTLASIQCPGANHSSPTNQPTFALYCPVHLWCCCPRCHLPPQTAQPSTISAKHLFSPSSLQRS